MDQVVRVVTGCQWGSWLGLCVECVQGTVTCFLCVPCSGRFLANAEWLNHPIRSEIVNRGLSLLSPIRVGAGNRPNVKRKGNG